MQENLLTHNCTVYSAEEADGLWKNRQLSLSGFAVSLNKQWKYVVCGGGQLELFSEFVTWGE